MVEKPRFAVYLSTLFAAALLLLGASAHAQRAKAAPKASVARKSGVQTKRWTANGVRFEHRTHGNSKIGWERRATRKDGSTSINGVMWGSKIKGTATAASPGKPAVETITATAPGGATRTTTTVTEKSGTTRSTIVMKPEGTTRKITTWKVGGTQMTATRDYKTGTKQLIQQSRRGQKAQK